MALSSTVLGPDGQPAERPEPARKTLVGFSIWERVGMPLGHLRVEEEGALMPSIGTTDYCYRL